MANVTINDRLAKIAVNKSLVKEFGTSSQRIVYLNNGSEFQIQLFNPYTYTIGAIISMNGIEMPNRLVIKPGQRIWLERYLDEARKFIFETYEVDGTPETTAAIQKNGEVSVKFYKEKEKKNYDVIQPNIYWTNEYNHNYVGDYVKSSPSSITGARSKGIATHLESNANECLGFAPSSFLSCDCEIGVNTAQAAVDCLRTTFSKATQDSVEFEPSTYKTEKTIETGRVERGGYSSQQFGTIDIDFDYWPFKTEIIKILPTSQKPITNKDLQKIYCTNCGRKLNTKFKFCPYCGAQIEY